MVDTQPHHASHASHINQKPSVCAARKARQQAEIASQKMQLQDVRMELAKMSDALTTRLDAIEKKLETRSTKVQSPPGLPTIVEEALLMRLERLETILVCNPPSTVQPSLSSVLDALVTQQGKQLSESSLVHSPDSELSPIKVADQSCSPKSVSTPSQPNFERYEEACTVSSSLDASVQSLFDRCSAICDDVQSEVGLLKAKKKHEEIKELIVEKFDAIFNECPMVPATSMDRDEIRKKYSSHDKHWIWRHVCARYHNSTKDPIGKSDDFLKIMYIIYELIEGSHNLSIS